MQYVFKVNFVVEEENESEAKQALVDYLQEICSGTDLEDHGIKNITPPVLLDEDFQCADCLEGFSSEQQLKDHQLAVAERQVSGL